LADLTVVYDSCVLYPAPMRDLLMHLALTDLFRARWTEQIHIEWMESVLADRPDLSREQLERTRTLMDSHVRDCLVTGYEHLVDRLTLPDPNDRHVLAAAIHVRANVVLTLNLRDFPSTALAPHRLKAVRPDDFVLRLLEQNTATVCLAVSRQRANLRKPAVSAEQLLDTFERQSLVRTAACLRELADQI
jgi:hypothetical protein